MAQTGLCVFGSGAPQLCAGSRASGSSERPPCFRFSPLSHAFVFFLHSQVFRSICLGLGHDRGMFLAFTELVVFRGRDVQ